MDEHAEFHTDRTPAGLLNGSSTRRSLLAALVAAGVTAFVAPAMVGRAGAATDDSVVQRTPEDDGILNALLERETRMMATYKEAVAATNDRDHRAGFLLIHDHHLAYVQAITGFLGTTVEPPANSSALRAVTGSPAAMAAVLADLEQQTVDLHLGALGRIIGMDASTLIASIVTAEARHVAALSVVAGQSLQSIVAQ